MTPRTIREIAQAVEGDILQGDPDTCVSGVSIDSRLVAGGDLFVAFRGERADGHDFVEQAFQQGAAAAFVDHPVPASGPLIRVNNPLTAVQCLAMHERRAFTGPVVGVTGSNGKTTTKDLLSAVFEAEGPCLATPANLNNELGLPLTILRRDPAHRTMVLEMGMRGLGQIRQLCNIAQPTAGIITNIGHSHIELLGSQENIARAKAELLEALPETGVAALCRDDPWLVRLSACCRGRVVWYGLNEGDAWAGEVRLTPYGTRFVANVLGERAEIHVPTFGRHNVRNALGALLLGAVHGLKLADMAERLQRATVSSGRLRLIPGRHGWQVVDDCYNASPASVIAGIDTLLDLAAGGFAAAVLGDMLELGSYEREGHQQVGHYLADRGVGCLVAIGPRSRETVDAARAHGCPQVHWFMDKEQAMAALDDLLPPGANVLVKGSRAMHLEDVVAHLTQVRDEAR